MRRELDPSYFNSFWNSRFPGQLPDQEYAGTALSWALYSSGNSWRGETGDFVGTVRALLEAGAVLPSHPEALEPSDAVLEVLP